MSSINGIARVGQGRAADRPPPLGPKGMFKKFNNLLPIT